MADADASARVTGQCGDTMEIYFKFENDRVKAATYFTDGCASSAICGSFAAELALDQEPDGLADITGEAVLKKIGRLPPEDRHCASLAAATVQTALDHYMQQRRGR